MKQLYRQFSKPEGLLGWLAGTIMSVRPFNRIRNRWTVELLNIQNGQSVLEIGFGPGLAIQKIHQDFPNCRIKGIDHSSLIVETASRRNRGGVQAGKIELFCGDVESLSKLGKHDRIFALNSHMFWKDLRSALAAIAKHLNPNGVIAITYQPRGPNASDGRAISEANELSLGMSEVGFVEVRVEQLDLSPLTICVLGKLPEGRA